MVMVLAQKDIDAGQLTDAMSQPLPLDAATILMPSMQPSTRGPWVSVSYTGSDGVNSLVGYAMALVKPEGTGILYVVAGPTKEADYFLGLIGQLASSTDSAEVAADSGADTGAGVTETAGGDTSVLAQQWTQHLSGQKMTYLHSFTSGGEGSVDSSAKREMYLCRDGRFFYEEESSVSVSVPGVSGSDPSQDSGSGIWRIVTQGNLAGIELRWSSGGVSTHKLDFNNGETYFDEERWFVTDDNNYC